MRCEGRARRKLGVLTELEILEHVEALVRRAVTVQVDVHYCTVV